MRRFPLAIVLLQTLVACSKDAARTPQSAVEEYYAKEAPQAGEVVGHRALQQDSADAVFATTIEQDDSVAEWYSFLSLKKGEWTVDAAKTLQLSDEYYDLLDSLEQVDSLDEHWPAQYANLDLVVSSDSTIRMYLVEHQPILDSIVHLFEKRAVMSAVDVATAPEPEIRDGKVVTSNRNSTLHDMLVRAGVTRIFRDARYPGCTFVRINGMNRAQAGYVYAPEECTPPMMSPQNFIYVEKAADQWYVYKVI